MMQPPTDNLYKFLAIFGLIVFGFSFYLPLQRLEEHSRELAKWNAAWGPMLERAVQADDDSRTDLVCAIAEAEKVRPQINSQECKGVAATRVQRANASRDLQIAMTELQSGKHMLSHLQRQFETYRTISIVTGLLGLLVCTAGFWFWYVRVQRPLDEVQARAVQRTGERATTDAET
ncbi:hypothetical protein [Thauera sp. 2A1]|uniref:hypothetical protein n=1 Tax=Thauera sp. 2A1 TaxID=2570191 RepID=UPI001290D4E9|nr:hypothetical protein [Thauera sp. 2A1]KAI5913786.1 hypothetical protein GH664_16070 [Thauera sp. 2A1]